MKRLLCAAALGLGILAARPAGAQEARDRGLLVSEVVIPNASKELYSEYI